MSDVERDGSHADAPLFKAKKTGKPNNNNNNSAG